MVTLRKRKYIEGIIVNHSKREKMKNVFHVPRNTTIRGHLIYFLVIDAMKIPNISSPNIVSPVTNSSNSGLG